MTPTPPPGETFYSDGRVSIRQCTVPTRDGSHKQRAVVIHPGAVVILPITADRQIVFIRNHRWQVGEALIELPAGTCDKPDEPLAEAAARELAEEAGYAAERWTQIASLYAAPGGSTEVMHFFVAEGLTWVGQTLEPDETIEVVPMPIDAALERLASGGFADMKTVAALGMWQAARLRTDTGA